MHSCVQCVTLHCEAEQYGVGAEFILNVAILKVNGQNSTLATLTQEQSFQGSLMTMQGGPNAIVDVVGC
jgi:hypothetical protein